MVNTPYMDPMGQFHPSEAPQGSSFRTFWWVKDEQHPFGPGKCI